MELATIYKNNLEIRTELEPASTKDFYYLRFRATAPDGKCIRMNNFSVYDPSMNDIEYFRGRFIEKATEAFKKGETNMLSLASTYTFGEAPKADAFIKTIVNEYDKRNMQMIASKYFGIKQVIFSPPATIVMWADGTKTVVKAQNEDFDPEKGLAMAFARKALGNKHSYYDVIRKHTKKFKK